VNSKWKYPWYRRKWWELFLFVVSTCELALNSLCQSKALEFFHSFSPINLGEYYTTVICIFPNFIQNLRLIRCSRNRSLIFVTKRRNKHVLSASQLPYDWRWCIERGDSLPYKWSSGHQKTKIAFIYVTYIQKSSDNSFWHLLTASSVYTCMYINTLVWYLDVLILFYHFIYLNF